MAIKALLIDSGKVLNKPATGHWMISLNFFDYVNKKAFYSFTKKQRAKAFQEAMMYLKSVTLITSIEEEVKYFTFYYEIFFKTLGMLIPKKNYELIAKDMVYSFKKYVFYEDAKAVIPKFYETYDLAVVSDAWPSLNQVFEQEDFKDYFKAIIISTEVGFKKPDQEMYLKAIKNLQFKPSECAFIDDQIRNCDGAKAVGIKRTYLLCRHPLKYLFFKLKYKDHQVVRNFYEIQKSIEKS